MTSIARLAVADMVERHVARLGLLIDQHAMALRERAALAVLAGEADRMAFVDERREGQRFAHRPVDALARLDHRLAIVEEALDACGEDENLPARR